MQHHTDTYLLDPNINSIDSSDPRYTLQDNSAWTTLKSEKIQEEPCQWIEIEEMNQEEDVLAYGIEAIGAQVKEIDLLAKDGLAVTTPVAENEKSVPMQADSPKVLSEKEELDLQVELHRKEHLPEFQNEAGLDLSDEPDPFEDDQGQDEHENH